jgi:hypothetical protein
VVVSAELQRFLFDLVISDGVFDFLLDLALHHTLHSTPGKWDEFFEKRSSLRHFECLHEMPVILPKPSKDYKHVCQADILASSQHNKCAFFYGVLWLILN